MHPGRRERVRLGRIYADVVTFEEAVELVCRRAQERKGGYVVTPNVDHVVLAEHDDTLKQAYDEAFLSLVDGKPLLWWARTLGHPFPAKISGSDFTEPLVARAAELGLPVYFLGAQEGVGRRAADILQQRVPRLEVAGVVSPPLGFERSPEQLDAIFSDVEKSGARILLIALGCPKQEHFMYRERARLSSVVALGIGGTFDFIAGHVKRAPRVFSELGLEWTWRLAQQPRRMAERYLVRDRAIVGIVMRSMTTRDDERVFTVDDG
jgi:N-acetylglucosaminyldiphosphoundecaprenol N-acetyl-beta-D-mannosaminyltransferase